MRQANRLVLAFIICLTAMGIAIVGTHTAPISSENPPNNHSEVAKVFVKVVIGIDEPLTEQQKPEEWIVQQTTRFSSPYVWETTDWLEVTENNQRIYSSMMGGRLIEVRLIPNEQPQRLTVEINGL
jgi:hypothetical protein